MRTALPPSISSLRRVATLAVEPEAADPWDEAPDPGGVGGVLLAVNPLEVGLLDQTHVQLERHRQEDCAGDRSGRRPRGA